MTWPKILIRLGWLFAVLFIAACVSDYRTWRQQRCTRAAIRRAMERRK